MIEIILIRHGATAWNETGLYQGRSDIALSEAGEREVKTWKRAPEWNNYRVVASPLKRSQQTAELLFPTHEIESDLRLVEIDFGDWEGESIEKLKSGKDTSPPSYGWEGWKSGPPGGETYQQVAERFQAWLTEISLKNRNVVAVTHKGVILTALGLAHRWDMASKRPFKISKGVFQSLVYSKERGLEVKALNQGL